MTIQALILLQHHVIANWSLLQSAVSPLYSSLYYFRYAKRFLAWLKRKEETEEDVFTRWEKDFELPPLSRNGLFEEYLELGESVLRTVYMSIYTRYKKWCGLFAEVISWLPPSILQPFAQTLKANNKFTKTLFW